MEKMTTYIILACLVAVLSSCTQSDEILSIPKKVFIDESSTVVYFEGRWKLLSETTPKVTPITKVNSVKGACSKETLTCEEHIAKLSFPSDNLSVKNTLYIDKFEYEIVDWTSIFIRAVKQLPHGDVELKISILDENIERTWRQIKGRGSETADSHNVVRWMLK